jgi:hypothetical protein
MTQAYFSSNVSFYRVTLAAIMSYWFYDLAIDFCAQFLQVPKIWKLPYITLKFHTATNFVILTFKKLI